MQSNEENNENLDIKNIILNILGIIIFLCAYFIPFFRNNVKILMYIVSYIIIGFEVFEKAAKHLFKKDMFDENLLMTIATIGALCIGEYIEGIVVLLLYKFGEFLQDIAVDKSKNKIRKAIDIRAKHANLIVDGKIQEVDPCNIKIGDIVVVKNGEKIPTDGTIFKGKSNLDTSTLTGESIPLNVKKDDEVLSGMINLGDTIEVKVTKEFENSAASKILDLIENAKDKKSKTENFITKFSKIYTPIVILIAILIVILFPLILNIKFVDSLNRALIFLVVSCPCALVISVPLGFFVGMGNCSKHGILVKGSNNLDILANVDTIAFDKTGTLTEGVFKISKINNQSNLSDDEMLEYIALSEMMSNHYIAKSIINSVETKLEKEKIKSHTEISGRGIKANIEEKEVLVGNKKLMNENNIQISEFNDVGTIVHLAIDKEYIGNIVLSDSLKKNVDKLNFELKKKFKIKNTVLLTGDKKEISEKISKDLEFDRVYSELLPQNKVEIVDNLKNNTNGKVAFVGDGINDSPVLVSADIGISMGKGSDIAIDSSDIVLVTDEPSKIIQALKIATKTKMIVIQNIAFALIVKLLVLILSAVGISSMWEAIFADVGVSLIAIANSIRIFKVK